MAPLLFTWSHAPNQKPNSCLWPMDHGSPTPKTKQVVNSTGKENNNMPPSNGVKVWGVTLGLPRWAVEGKAKLSSLDNFFVFGVETAVFYKLQPKLCNPVVPCCIRTPQFHACSLLACSMHVATQLFGSKLLTTFHTS